MSQFYDDSWKNTPCVRGSNVRKWYIRTYGPISEDILVLHKCDSEGLDSGCINPTHLWLGTQSENMADCVDKGRNKGWEHHKNVLLSEEHKKNVSLAIRGQHNGMSVLTEDSAFEIKYSKLNNYELASKFGVSTLTVWKIKTGRSWKHL